jgi:hypothetical protein
MSSSWMKRTLCALTKSGRPVALPPKPLRCCALWIWLALKAAYDRLPEGHSTAMISRARELLQKA